MSRFPVLNIYFPEAKLSELIEGISRIVSTTTSWRSAVTDPMGKKIKEGDFYFIRNADKKFQECYACLNLQKPGVLLLNQVVTDRGLSATGETVIVNEFERMIRATVEQLGGMTAGGLAFHRLEDYFSRHTIEKLKCFIETSNDMGSRPSDRRKWHEFLIAAHSETDRPSGNILNECIINETFDPPWPEEFNVDLIREYNFAMDLLDTLSLIDS